MSNYITIVEAEKRDIFSGLKADAIRRLCRLKRIECKNVGTEKKPWYLIPYFPNNNVQTEKRIEGEEIKETESQVGSE